MWLTTLNECFTFHGSEVIADKLLAQEKRVIPYVFKKYEVVLVATFLTCFCALPGMHQISRIILKFLDKILSIATPYRSSYLFGQICG